MHLLSRYLTDGRNCELLSTDNIAEFRAGPEIAPPDASLLLASVLLAIEMATSPAALTTWCDRHLHLHALLTPGEQAIAASRALRRWAVWELGAQASVEALAAWWATQQPTLRSLLPDDLRLVVDAKETVKARLVPSPTRLPPQSVVRPHSRAIAMRSEGRLL